MSVYTPVSHKDAEAFVAVYSIGQLQSLDGIEDGITNTNYWLSTDGGEYVLTIYEQHEPATLDYILGLQLHLRNEGVTCSSPVINDRQQLYSKLQGKPAAILHRQKGQICNVPGAQQCALIGREMAKFHIAGSNFPTRRNNPCGEHWRSALRQKLHPLLTPAEQALLDEEFATYRAVGEIELPAGATHCDLFRDNCLFDDDKLGGIIDFDYACYERFIYDIAVSLNDCCIQADGSLDETLSSSFLQNYQNLRPLQEIEMDHLGIMLRLAATRFWLSRLHDQHFPKPGEMTFLKDPNVFKNILVLRRNGL